MRGVAGVVLGVGRRRLQPSDGGSVLHTEDGWGFDAQNGDLVHGTTQPIIFLSINIRDCEVSLTQKDRAVQASSWTRSGRGSAARWRGIGSAWRSTATPARLQSSGMASGSG